MKLAFLYKETYMFKNYYYRAKLELLGLEEPRALERCGRGQLDLALVCGYLQTSQSFSICGSLLSSFCFFFSFYSLSCASDALWSSTACRAICPTEFQMSNRIPNPCPSLVQFYGGQWQAALTSPSWCPKHESKTCLFPDVYYAKPHHHELLLSFLLQGHGLAMPDTYHSGWEEEEQLVGQAVAWAAGLGHECPAEVWEPAGLAAIRPGGGWF